MHNFDPETAQHATEQDRLLNRRIAI
jgi:hypothetical protein